MVMIKCLCGLAIGIPMVASSAPVAKISEHIEISTVTGCPVAQLRLQNRSGTIVYVDKEPPMLSIDDESGVSVKNLFSPGYSKPGDLNNYVRLESGGTQVYVIRLSQDYDLKPDKVYTVKTGGQFTDPITHQHVVVSAMQTKFRYSSSCQKR
jgi:hypothetical protein